MFDKEAVDQLMNNTDLINDQNISTQVWEIRKKAFK